MSARRARRSSARWSSAISVSTTSIGSPASTVRRMSAGLSSFAFAAIGCTIQTYWCRIQVVVGTYPPSTGREVAMAQQIVMGVDGSETSLDALAAAADLAEQTGSQLSVIFVRDPGLAGGATASEPARGSAGGQAVPD